VGSPAASCGYAPARSTVLLAAQRCAVVAQPAGEVSAAEVVKFPVGGLAVIAVVAPARQRRLAMPQLWRAPAVISMKSSMGRPPLSGGVFWP
jgi:hypothetical protein